MSAQAGAIVRALVAHLRGDQRAYALLARLLETIDITLAGLVPPPPAVEQEQAPELPPEPVYSQPRSERR